MVATRKVSFIASLAACFLIGPSAFATPQLWTTPDGRYSARFGAEPRKHRINAKEAVGVGYTLLESTPSGPVSYALQVTVLDVLKKRPSTDGVREFLEMSANAFLETLGVADSKKSFTWSEFKLAGPALNYQATFEYEGTAFFTRGYMLMDDISIVRFSVSHPVALNKVDQNKAAEFLLTLMMNTSESIPIREFAAGVGIGAGGEAVTCPPHLVNGAREGVVKEGGSLIEMQCFSFDESEDEVIAALEEVQVDLALGRRKGPWKISQTGARVRVMAYGKDVVSWWVVPRSALAGLGIEGSRTTVLTQLLGERRSNSRGEPQRRADERDRARRAATEL